MRGTFAFGFIVGFACGVVGLGCWLLTLAQDGMED